MPPTTIALASLILLILSALPACHDDVVGVPPPSTTGVSANLPTYTAERSAPDSGQIILTGEAVSRNHLRLYVRQNVLSRPVGANLRLRIDPTAHATVSTVTLGASCGSFPADVDATGTPSEWNVHRATSGSDCSLCGPPTAPLFTVDLYVGSYGSWPVSLAGSGFPTYYGGTRDVNGCGVGWHAGREFFGGTITNVSPP